MYSVKVSEKDRRRVIQQVVDEHLVDEGVEDEELGLQGFDLNLFDKDSEGCVGDYVKELHYLLMLMKS